MITRLHHSGFTVNELKESLTLFTDLGFEIEKEFEIPAEKAKAAFLKIGDNGVELWELEDRGTPFAKMVEKHTGFECDSIEIDCQKLIDSGFVLVSPIRPGATVKQYCYLKDRNDNYFELLEVV